ncbi:MAG: PaaI family thioesterase [Candidatus Fermentibacteraceae bacterium]
MNLEDEGFCFACGPGNKSGLRLKFKVDAKARTATTETVLDHHFNGWKGFAHGGIVSTLLDETMIYACGVTGWLAVTAEITVRFLRPVPTGVPVTVTGYMVEDRGRFYVTGGEITKDGETLASATGKMFPVKKVPDIEHYLQGRYGP